MVVCTSLAMMKPDVMRLMEAPQPRGKGPAVAQQVGRALGWQRRRRRHDVSFPQKKLEIIEIN
jgi:hypothetical protein